MATSPAHRRDSASQLGSGPAAHADVPAPDPLKQVPESRADRQRIRHRAIEVAAGLDKTHPFTKPDVEAHARAILDELHLPEAFIGWTMVALGSAFWRDQVVSIPHDRRLLLLPHCLRDAERCPATYDEFGLQCRDCGSCLLTDLRATAREQGYRVLVAEGSPIVLQIILSGHVDAVLGVACLDSLEKAFNKLLLAGLPSMAVPLLAGTCRNTATDEDWVREMIATPYRPGTLKTRTYVHLLRSAAGMFEPHELDRLVPRSRGGPSLAETNGQGLAALDPIAATEAVARDFLLKGGKHLRPFITLAVYDAMTGGQGSGPEGARHVAQMPDAVKRVALAIEAFHKASLVHDDIEDDDPYRYGHPAIHRTYGTATAINVGDYLIGLGYRLIAEAADGLGAEAVADVLARLGRAHTRLCEGQGAELAWRDARNKRLQPLDALKIYALKTAPAFEAALYTGLRLAGRVRQYDEPAARFARHLGVAFQILNDLDDWENDQPNKRTAATDVLGRRPTVLWALALEGLDRSGRHELESVVAAGTLDESTTRRVRQLYDRAGVFQKAGRLVAKHRRRAREVADQIRPDPLRHLLHCFADTIVPRMKHEE